MVKIFNSFTLAFLSQILEVDLHFERISPFEVTEVIEKHGGLQSFVGHADTAKIFSGILGIDVPQNRGTFTWDLNEDIEIIVGQYNGPRLPEGATQLPEGAEIVWWLIYES